MIFIVLPAYNEEQDLPNLLQSIQEGMEEARLTYKVLVVDDGSQDQTWAVIERFGQSMPVVGLRHPQNRGLADALRTGLGEALKQASLADVIVTMDADNTHAPGLAMRMLGLVREGYDVVIASRYVEGARVLGVPLHRRILSGGASLIMRLAFPIRGVRDYTCGYRAYRAAILKEAAARYDDQLISEKGFSCMVDILLKLRHMKALMTEVPVVLRYDRKHGMTKMRVAVTTWETLKLLVRRFGER